MEGETAADGLRKSLERKETVVTFDDTKTNVGALLDATKNAGYPSSLKSGPPKQ